MSNFIVIEKDSLNKVSVHAERIVLSESSIVHTKMNRDDVAEFIRDGNNLILKLTNGEVIVIENFFVVDAEGGTSDLVFEEDGCVLYWFDGLSGFKEISGLEALLPAVEGSKLVGLLPWLVGAGVVGGIIVGQDGNDKNIQKDTIKPFAPSVSLTTDSGSDNKDGITNNGDYTVSGIEDGATVEYSTDGGKTWISEKPVAQEGENSISVRQIDKAGNVSASTDIKFTLDTTAPTATLSIDAVTADNVVNAAEAGKTVTLTGNVTGEFTEGDIVTLTINNQQYTAEVQANGSWSVDVAGSDLLADGDQSIAGSVVVHDVAGNPATVTADKVYSVDTTAPTATLSIDAVTADNVVNAAEAGKTVTLTGNVTGEFTEG
ncbi:Ig-like domain-containing protein, partial [Acinetobacter sp. YH12080]|uniref:Ig-like domain-containing protein n=1 Tax=Acinetobacter sp. YH12080 TaxID=2601073 RepID=UPI0015D2A09A